MNKMNTLENIATVALATGSLVGIASNVLKSDFPGKLYIGDSCHINAYCVVSDYIARTIEQDGERRGSKLVKKLGEYFNEISIPLVTTYFVLGETVIDWIPGNVMDEKDTYAAIAGGVIGILYARGVKRRRKRAEHHSD